MVALTLVPVHIIAKRADGTPVANARVRFTLTVADRDGQLVVPTIYSATTDSNGEATPNVWPNTRGVNGSQYQVEIQGDGLAFRGLATVPEYSCNLHEILTLQPGTVTDAQAAVLLARDWAIKLGAPVDGAELSAKAHAQAAAADRALADADKNQTGLDRLQTGSDRTQTGADVTAANTARDTSIAQASLAAGYAASAASVAQQDLSGVTAAALHRSPNAVVAMCIDDPRTHSDGGAWLAKCEHLSWYNEPLNGKWLGSQATEAAARAVSGATTGDYFQLTTDGKFYKLNAVGGTTEVFRGNVAKYGRTAWVVEAARVVGYAIDQVGRPMWLVFAASASTYPVIPALGRSGVGVSRSCVAAGNGTLWAGSTGNGAEALIAIDFAKDRVRSYSVSNNGYDWLGNIAQRNTALPLATNNAYTLPSAVINAVALTTMPDAPVDPVTWLQVPTIAVATAAGASVIKHDGSVVTPATNVAGSSISINQYACFVDRDGTTVPYVLLSPGQATNSSAFQIIGNGAAPDVNLGTPITGGHAIQGRSTFGMARSGSILSLLRLNESSFGASLAARITPTHNTGWMVGDIRRCYPSDVSVGTVGPGAAVTDNFAADTWTHSGTVTWSAGQYVLSNGGTIGKQVVMTSGKTYVITVIISANTTTSSGITARLGNGFAQPTYGSVVEPSAGFVGSWTFYMTAGQDNPFLSILQSNVGQAATITSISFQEAVLDRSYKAQGVKVFGTLTKAQVGAGSQIVAYSGWSAANYLQEAYSADLDYGTGGFDLMPWVSIPATAATTPLSLSASAFPVIGSELVTNGDFSGGTTGWTFAGLDGGQSVVGGALQITCVTDNFVRSYQALACTVGKNYRVTVDVTAINAAAIAGGGINVYVHNGNAGTPSIVAGGPTPFNITATGTYTFTFQATFATMYFQAVLPSADNGSMSIDNVSVKEVGPSVIVERSAATGAYSKLGIDVTGAFVGEVYDGTTTRTVKSTASYAGAGYILPELSLATSGSLTLKVNGAQVAQTTGVPLLTLNNASAVLTIGNNFGLTAPFPGSIALVRIGATIPSDDASLWIYQREAKMFRDGAQVTLPDSGAVVDMDYDAVQDKWKVVSAANESAFVGLVRVSTAPVAAGSFVKVSHQGGVKLLARSTTNPGVDITIPPKNTIEEFNRRAEDAARLARPTSRLDWTGGFTATTAVGSALLTGVANLVVPAGCTVKGAAVTGTGVPAGTTILDYSGTTVQLSAAITGGAGSGVQINLLSFPLPTGMELVAPRIGGTVKQEGASKDFTRTFNGFREAPLWPTGAPPGNTAWVQTEVRRVAS